MQLQTVKRTKQKARVALLGCSGAGKTYSALLLAYGLCAEWSRITVIDAENTSASLYSHLGAFKMINLNPPYQPDKFIEALEKAENASQEVIIIDSLSQAWSGWGGIEQLSHSLNRNKRKVKEELLCKHYLLLHTLLNSNSHIIATLRTKEAYLPVEGTGYSMKVGLEPLQKEDIGYDFTSALQLDMKHQARVNKDRTGLFKEASFQITTETGSRLLKWCEEGEEVVPMELQQRIDSCSTLQELHQLLFREQVDEPIVLEAFSKRRLELEGLNSIIM